MSRYAVFDDDDDEEENDVEESTTMKSSSMITSASAIIPGEDLSLMRRDEELALQTVYQEDFRKMTGTWGGVQYEIQLKPPDLAPEDVGSSLTLNALLGRQYPYVAPRIQFDHVKGIRDKESSMLMNQVQIRAKECASQGQEMMFELAIVVEEFLLKCNRTPKEQTMSAWEQMKQRESLTVAKTNKDQALEVLPQFSKSYSSDENDQVGDEYAENSNEEGPEYNRAVNYLDIERELQRQSEALDAVATRRRKNTMENNNDTDVVKVHEYEDYNEEVDVEDEDEDIGVTTYLHSRYHTDFVELGILGKGGGGLVVKCRNRLDRRIYAIKKILLEPERGRFAKHAAIQNRKLRREVTTISRMTHKNIVRYYQAWVEGDNRNELEDESTSKLQESEVLSDNKASNHEPQYNHNSIKSVSSKSGWWNLPIKETVYDENMSDGSFASAFKEDDAIISALHLFPNNGVWQNPLLDPMFELEADVDRNKQAISHHNSAIADFSSSAFGSHLREGRQQKCLYIQMEYCSTTLRHLIDKSSLTHDENEIWRLTRQIIEALVYVHSRKLIHRDLKPSNIFIDNESNIRVGDFGLATSSRKNQTDIQLLEDGEHSVGIEYESFHSSSRNIDKSQPSESLTTGVGTTFYRAPEQGLGSLYDEKVDIFSLGVVIFELFHRPFTTYMERAEILTKLRGDNVIDEEGPITFNDHFKGGDQWEKLVLERFPATFSATEDAKRLILWCLRRDPKERPSANELLSSHLLPGKMELEKHYLEEALRTLSNPQSETYNQILCALFAQLQPYHVEVTYDSDLSIKASHQMRSVNVQKTLLNLCNKLGGSRWGDIEGGIEYLSATNALSIIAIHSSLQRAQGIEKVGRGLDFGIPQKALSAIAMNASAASIMGVTDGVIGSDPRIIEGIKKKLRDVFRLHSAIELSSPLLLPSQGFSKSDDNTKIFNPVELMNKRGHVLLLPEDLTANFARAIARGGVSSARLKRYEIGKVYHDSLLGGHPRESFEAAFDIVFQDAFIKGDYLEAEVIQVLCQAVSSFNNSQDFNMEPSESSVIDKFSKDSSWFLRITHTRITEAFLEICGLPRDTTIRRAYLRFLSTFLSPVESGSVVPNSVRGKTLDELISDSLLTYKVSDDVHAKMKTFIGFFEGPLSKNISTALDEVQYAFSKMKVLEIEIEKRPKLVKAYDMATKGIRSIRRLVSALNDIGIFGVSEDGSNNSISRGNPAFTQLDFFEQKQKHIHGGIYFQGIFFPLQEASAALSVHNSLQKQLHEEGIKFVEGGRFDDLIRTYRPPGNFGPSIVNSYTTAPIPLAAGVRFHIGKIVDRIYQVAAINKQEEDTYASIGDLDAIRCVLGHPLPSIHSIKCIVSGTSGLDAASARARAEVSSYLWSGGIASEYLPQSGAILAMLRNHSNDELSSDWTLDQIFQVCFLLRIPFLVIVAPHFLRDKRSVRVKQVYHESLDFKSLGGHEEVVKLGELANFIRDSLDVRQKRLAKSLS